MTLSQSLERSLTNNPRLLEAKQEMGIARTHVSQAKSLFFPRMDLNFNYVRYKNVTLGITSPDLGYAVLETTPGLTESASFESENLYLGRLGFKQTLYAGGRINSTLQLSKANWERSKINYESLVRSVEFQVKKGFYSLLSSAQKKELVNKAQKDLDALGSKIQDSHGRMLLIRARAELRETLAQIQNEEKGHRFEYLQAVGLELFSEIDVKGNLDIADSHLDLQQALAWAKQNRNELKATQLAEEADRLSVNLAMSERYPVFQLGGAYERRDQDMSLSKNNWNAVLSMSLPIFDGFSSLARIKQSRFKAKQGQYQRVQLEDQVEKEVRAAFDEMTFWKEEMDKRLEENQSLKELSGRSLAGRPVSDRVDAIKWNLESSLKVADAQLNLALAKGRLELSLGRTLPQ